MSLKMVTLIVNMSHVMARAPACPICSDAEYLHAQTHAPLHISGATVICISGGLV